MSSTVDNRVVEMRFDNANFESGVKQSLSTLEKLKSALNFTGASKGLSEVGNAANNLSSAGLGNIANSINSVADRFSNLGIVGMTVLQHLTEQAVSAGERIVKSLTIDQVTAGWSKYADKTTAVQTIMAATASQFADVDTQMSYVNDQLSKLNWFTDETSYNFVDMVGNIGKFTSNGIGLDQAVTSMQGIANWAAISGQNAATASRAMYNLAQAIGTGSVKLIDWRSIENANMATQEFKQTVLEAAVAQGKLTKATDGTYKTLKGTTVSVQDFNTALSEGWFSKDVLTSVLDKYGAVTNKLYDLSEASGATATDILQLVDAQKAGTLSEEMLAEAMDDSAISVEEFKAGIEDLSSAENEFGLKTFKAAQEAKTFRDAIDATADAASTAWMNIFETIFGDYMQAKSLWTDFANFLYDTLVSPLENVQELLDSWAKRGGKDAFLEGLKNIGPSIASFIAPVKEAFRDIFPAKTADEIILFTYKLRDTIKNLKLSSETADKLRTIFRGLFSVVDIGKKAFKGFLSSLTPLKGPLKTLGNSLLDVGVKIANFAIQMNEKFSISPTIREFFTFIGGMITSLANGIPEAISKIQNAFSGLKIGEKLKSLKDTIANSLSGIFDVLDDNGNVVRKRTIIEAAVDGIVAAFNKLKSSLQPVKEMLSSVWESIKQWGSANLNAGGILKLAAAFAAVKIAKKKSVGDALSSFIENISGGFEKVVDKATSALTSFRKVLELFNVSGLATNLLKIAGAVGILAVSLIALSSTDPKKLGIACAGLAAGVLVLVGAIKLLTMEGKDNKGGILGKILTGKASLASAGTAILAASVGLLALAGAMKILGTMDLASIGQAFVAMGSAMLILVAALEVLAKTCGGAKLIAAATALAAVSAAMVVLAAAVAAFSLIATMPGFVDGMVGMATGIAAITASLLLLAGLCSGAKLISAAASILVVSAAMTVLATSLAVLSLIDSDKLAGSLIAFAASLTVVAGGLAILSVMGPGTLVAAAALLAASAAMLVIAASMVVFAAGLQLMTGVEWGSIALGMLEVAGALVPFNLAGVGLVAASAGFIAGAAGITVLAAALALAAKPIQSLSNANISDIASSTVELSVAFLGLAGGTAALTALSPVLKSTGKNLSNFGDGAKDAIKQAGPLQSMFSNIISISSEFVSSATEAVNAANNMVRGIAQAFASSTSMMISSGRDMAMSFANGFASGAGYASSAGSNVGASAYSGANSWSGSFYTIGYNMAVGTANGVYSGSGSVYNACVSMINNALRGAQNAAQIRSPSRKFANLVGKYIPLGTAKGIDKYSGSVSDATESMVEDSLRIASDTLSKIADAVNANTDYEPVITPVIDLSKVENGTKKLGEMLNSDTVSLGMSNEIQRQYARNQNAANSVPSVIATLDPMSLAAISGNQFSSGRPEVKISFGGSLAQLAAVLQPAIEIENSRLGPSLIKS